LKKRDKREGGRSVWEQAKTPDMKIEGRRVEKIISRVDDQEADQIYTG
jgi:hypothetical protein